MLKLDILLRVTHAHLIARRYFVVNGFDGALTMLGLIMGFHVSERTETATVISACVGAAVALGMSGISSAYISEAAERRRELQRLEDAMLADLGDSIHGQASRIAPAVIAAVNGLAPLLIAALIILPIGLSLLVPGIPALELSIALALVIIFFLGIFLGRISGAHWLFAGLKTLFVALTTCAIIYLFTG